MAQVSAVGDVALGNKPPRTLICATPSRTICTSAAARQQPLA